MITPTYPRPTHDHHSTSANPRSTTTADIYSDPIDDNHLSAASLLVQRANTASSQGGPTLLHTNTVNTSVSAVLPSTLPHLTSHPSEDLEDREGWVYWFLYPFSPNPCLVHQNPSPRIQLNHSGDDFSIQSQATSKKITSFSAWMKAGMSTCPTISHSTPHVPHT